MERTGQTFSTQASGTEFCSSRVCLVTQESNKKIRKQRLHGKLEHAGIAVMVQVKARFLHVSSEDWMTQIVKSHHRAGSTSYKAILCLEAKIQLLLPNLFFSFRSYHPLTLPVKASVSVHGMEPADWIWWAAARRSSLCHWNACSSHQPNYQGELQPRATLSGLLLPGGQWATGRDFAKLGVSSEPLWRVWSCFVKRCGCYLLTYFTLTSVHVGKKLVARICLNWFLFTKEI